jgi:hypothetical protein
MKVDDADDPSRRRSRQMTRVDGDPAGRRLNLKALNDVGHGRVLAANASVACLFLFFSKNEIGVLDDRTDLSQILAPCNIP